MSEAPGYPEEVSDPRIRVLAVGAVRRGRKVLVMREEHEPYRGSWVLPQGYARPGETLRQAGAREVHEELGLDVEIDALVGVYEEFAPGDAGDRLHWVLVCFLAHTVNDHPPRPSREAIDYAWIEPGAPAPMSPPIVQRMLADLAVRFRL